MFGSKREKVAGCGRRLHNEELRNMYALPYVISVIKSRRMRLAGKVAFMKDEKCTQYFGWKT